MKLIPLLVFLFSVLLVSAQPKSGTVTYKTENNIPYRSGEKLDEYLQERCKLDIYYPENVDSFIRYSPMFGQ